MAKKSEDEVKRAEEVLDNDPMYEAQALLPAWFIPRMMTDTWTFGLLLTTGVTLVVETITCVHVDSTGALWLDVTMSDNQFWSDIHKERGFKGMMTAPTSRTTASVRADQIVAAFELADT